MSVCSAVSDSVPAAAAAARPAAASTSSLALPITHLQAITRQATRSPVTPDSPTYPSFTAAVAVSRNATSTSRREARDMSNVTKQMHTIPGTPAGSGSESEPETSEPPPPPPPLLPLPPIPTGAVPASRTASTAVVAAAAAAAATAASATTKANSTLPRKAHYAQTPEQVLHTIRDRSREHYQRLLRERPSVPLLSTDGYQQQQQQRSHVPHHQHHHQHTMSMRSRSGSTRSAPAGPCITIVSGKGRTVHQVAAAPDVPTVPTRYGRVPTPVGCLPGTGGLRIEDWAIFGGPSESRGERPRWELPENCFNGEEGGNGAGAGGGGGGGAARRKKVPPGGAAGANGGSILTEMRQKVKSMIKGLHVNVSISFGEKGTTGGGGGGGCVEDREIPRQTRREMTLRIKNSKTGSCVYEILRHEDSKDEILTPLEDLRALFPYSKKLQRDLVEWNRHYQNPPQHWVVNFIPRAYLKRGYKLGEELCEYFMQHPDGCQYRVEYEPIGHAYCHVGTVVPRNRRKSRRGGDMWWEGGREKHIDFSDSNAR